MRGATVARVVAIEGSTARSFCSGGDVKEIALALKEKNDTDAAGAALGAEYNLVGRAHILPYVAALEPVGLSTHTMSSLHCRLCSLYTLLERTVARLTLVARSLMFWWGPLERYATL